MKGKEIALGNSSLVKGYAFVKDIVTIPYAGIPRYQEQHLTTQWLMKQYKGKEEVYGYVLTEIRKEKNEVSYPRSYGSVWFEI